MEKKLHVSLGQYSFTTDQAINKNSYGVYIVLKTIVFYGSHLNCYQFWEHYNALYFLSKLFSRIGNYFS